MYVFGHRIKYYSLLLYDVHVEALLSYESYKFKCSIEAFLGCFETFFVRLVGKVREGMPERPS